MYAVTKARHQIAAVNRSGKALYPKMFGPPAGGAAYYGQAYQWAEVVNAFR